MSITATATTVKFHVGLHVADLRRAAVFYRILFGSAPTKDADDHIRFELEEPPLVLQLVQSPQQPGGALNHLGLRLREAAELVAVQRRLEEAGIPTQRQDGVECCYARQTKFWVTDPDRNLWEIYVFEEDLDHSGFDGPPLAAPPAPGAVWEHRLTEPLPERIDRADGSVEEVRLEGTFNTDLPPERLNALLSEARRVLQPGGRLIVHGLVSDRHFPGKPALPGIASLVGRVPTWAEVADTLAGAGFGALHYEKLGDIHCFHVNGIELREMRLVAVRPVADGGPTEYVLYKGPFAEAEDEEGNVFPRGERVGVPARTRFLLQHGEGAGQFLFFSTASTK